jgi:uncharacterized protein (TIGR02284 family)
MAKTEQGVKTINGLLRGELAAVETYQQALAKVGEDKGAPQLRQIHQDHINAANALRKQIHSEGGEPTRSSGAWGTFASAVEGTAKLFGSSSALKALKEGEEHGLKDYEKALQDSELPSEAQALIRSSLVPQTRAHVATLEDMISWP